MDPTNAAAARDLREAVSAYTSYCYWVANGRMLVNADDDAGDIVEAARLHVGECIRTCQALGFTDAELKQILADATPGLSSPRIGDHRCVRARGSLDWGPAVGPRLELDARCSAHAKRNWQHG